MGKVVAINNPGLSMDYMLYLLKYDSMHRRLDNVTLEKQGDYLVVNGNKIRVTQETDPSKLKWGEYNVDTVLECTGKFLTSEKSHGHL